MMLSFSTILLFFTAVFAQPSEPNVDEHSLVHFVAGYPSMDMEREKGLRSKLGRFILGEKALTISKPVSIVARSPKDFWFLDQGLPALVEISGQEMEVPSKVRKEMGEFQSLIGLCKIPEGELLFSDSRLNRIYRYHPVKGILGLFTSKDSLVQPTGIAWCEQTSEVWIIETGAHRICIFDMKGNLKRQIGTRGTGEAEFNYPTHIWIDKDGKVYIIDSMNFRVQIFDSAGNFLRSFGQAGDATGYFARPKGIATDESGNIYIVDALFHTVQVFNPEGEFLYYFGGQGTEHGKFWLPSGLYIDGEGLIYVADSYNSRIEIFKVDKTRLQ